MINDVHTHFKLHYNLEFSPQTSEPTYLLRTFNDFCILNAGINRVENDFDSISLYRN